MTGVLEAVAALPNDASPTVRDIGGEEAIYDQRVEILHDSALPWVVSALCDSWPDLRSRENASSFLLDAVSTDDLSVFADVLEVVLNCAAALPEIVGPLTDQIRTAAARDGLAGEIALEAWTRLAIGGWCKHLELRGALAHRIDLLPPVDADASVFLTRAVSAALDHWNDDDLLQGLEALANVDGTESDASLELGLYSLGKAAAAPDISSASESLDCAISWLDRSLEEGDRNDAEVFLLATRALQNFTRGGTVARSDVETLEAAVFTYLEGFIGLAPHWRAPRSETAPAWLKLIAGLERATEIAEPAWWEPAAVIDTAAELYSAHTSLRLVVNWAEDDGSLNAESPENRQAGVAAIVRPRIEAGIAGQANSIALLDIWLGKHREMSSDRLDVDSNAEPLLTAVQELRDHLAEEAPPHPKALSGADPLPVPLRNALHLSEAAAAVLSDAMGREPGLLDVVQEIAAVSPPSTHAESEIIERVCANIGAIVPTAGVALELRSLVVPLVRFTSYYLDQLQSGSRKASWLGISAKPFPHESVLADAIDQYLRLGRVSHMGGV